MAVQRPGILEFIRDHHIDLRSNRQGQHMTLAGKPLSLLRRVPRAPNVAHGHSGDAKSRNRGLNLLQAMWTDVDGKAKHFLDGSIFRLLDL